MITTVALSRGATVRLIVIGDDPSARAGTSRLSLAGWNTMHELLREGADAVTWTSAVRVVRAGEVAALRRSSPDSAIVALVRSTEPAEAIAAQLAGADVVLPCADDTEPDQADLAAARTAARMLAERARVVRDQTRAAAHEFAGHASAVAMVAAAARVRRAGAAGRPTARGSPPVARNWPGRAGRVARSSGTSVEHRRSRGRGPCRSATAMRHAWTARPADRRRRRGLGARRPGPAGRRRSVS